MIWIALALGIFGLSLSALFSGSETGFYRATRLRLVLDAVAAAKLDLAVDVVLGGAALACSGGERLNGPTDIVPSDIASQ